MRKFRSLAVPFLLAAALTLAPRAYAAPSRSSEGTMLVASLVVETLPGKATTVVERMGRISGMGPIAGDGDHRITAEWKVPESDNPEGLSEVLRAMNPEILEVFATFEGEGE